MLAHLFRATPQRSRRAGNSIENQSDHSDGRQFGNHTHRDHQRYETRNASTTNSIRQFYAHFRHVQTVARSNDHALQITLRGPLTAFEPRRFLPG